MVTSTVRAWSIGIVIAILLLIIIYAVALFETYKYRTFIFAPYVRPTPPGPHFFPLGNVRPLTQEEIEQRNAIICASGLDCSQLQMN